MFCDILIYPNAQRTLSFGVAEVARRNAEVVIVCGGGSTVQRRARVVLWHRYSGSKKCHHSPGSRFRMWPHHIANGACTQYRGEFRIIIAGNVCENLVFSSALEMANIGFLYTCQWGHSRFRCMEGRCNYTVERDNTWGMLMPSYIQLVAVWGLVRVTKWCTAPALPC
jgi:hypothetical protein